MLGLSAFVFLLVLTVWFFPSVLINTAMLERVTQWLEKKGTDLRFQNARLSSSSEAFLSKRVTLSADAVCLVQEKNEVCFRPILVDAVVAFERAKLRVNFEKLHLDNGTVRWATPSVPESEEKKKTSDDRLWPEIPPVVKRFTFQDTRVEVVSIDVTSDDTKITGTADIQLEGSTDTKANAKLRVATKLTSGKTSRILRGDGTAEIDANQRVQYSLNTTFEEGKRTVSGNLTGSAENKKLHAELNVIARRLHLYFPKLELKQCKLDLNEGSARGERTLSTQCPMRVTGYYPPLKNASKWFRVTEATLEGAVHVRDLPERKGSLSGELALRASPLSQSVPKSRATLSTTLGGHVGDLPRNVELNSKAEIDVESFQELVALLRPYPWAVPAPLNQLEGTLRLEARGKGNLGTEGGEFPFKLTTRLSSTNQHLNLDVGGKFRMSAPANSPPESPGRAVASTKRPHHLELKAALSDVQLVVPRFDLKSPPGLMPDPRIKGSISVSDEKTEPSLTYHIEITTSTERPVRLLTSIARKSAIPLDVNLVLTETEGAKGTLKVLPFELELFRRKATLKRFRVKLASDAERSQVDGEVVVPYTDYTVQILILGQLKEPQIKFTSEPPLPEDKVIATLLFGRPPEELDNAEAAAVGGTRAAVADSAISLASMYLLASSPVESVGYNPVSRVFRAKIRLTDGTSLNIGSNLSELNMVGFRKRLAPHWSIVTTLENPLDPLERTVTAFLEWSKGY